MEMEARRPSNRHLVEIFSVLLISVVLLNPLGISVQAATSNLTPETIRAAVLQLGVLAPLGMIFLEWLQVVAAPIPPVTMVASGYTFGMFPGGLYSWIGMSLGSLTAMLLGRRFGRPVVEKVVSEDHMEKFYHLTEKHGLIVFTVIFILPGFPDDVVCYLAGLTDLDMKKLFLSASLGRLPTVAILVITGNSIALANTKVMVASLGVFAGISYLSVKNEEKIISTASRWEESLVNLFPFL